MQAWCANGYNTWSQVGADVARVHADSGDGDLTALASDGGQLASDARTAGSDPPPFDRRHRFDYQVGMGFLLTSGAQIVTGDIGTAADAMRRAKGYLDGDGTTPWSHPTAWAPDRHTGKTQGPPSVTGKPEGGPFLRHPAGGTRKDRAARL